MAGKVDAKAWGAALGVILLLVALVAWNVERDYRRTLDAEYRHMAGLARIADENITGSLRSIDLLLQDVAREVDSEPFSGDKALTGYMKARVAGFPEVRVLFVADAKGVITQSTFDRIVGTDGHDRPWFTEAREATEPTEMILSRPVIARPTGVYVIFATRARRTATGEFAGVVGVSVELNYFHDMLRSLQPGDDGAVILVNRQGDALSRSKDPDRHVGRNFASGLHFQGHLKSGERTSIHRARSAVDGLDRLSAARTTANHSLIIFVSRVAEVALAPWRRQFYVHGLTFLVLAGAVLLLTALIQRRRRELAAAKDFADQVIETANVMVVGLDGEGRVRVFNEAAEWISGYGREEVLGRDWFEMAVPRDRFPDIREELDRRKEGRDYPRTQEYPIQAKDGAQHVIAWQNSAIRQDGALAATISFGIDVTERRLAERRLRESEARFRTMADAAPVFIWTAGFDKRRGYFNRGWLEFRGRTMEQEQGDGWADGVHRDDLLDCVDAYAQAFNARQPYRGEYRLQRHDGEYRWMVEMGVPRSGPDGGFEGYIGSCLDITEQREFAARLAEAQEIGRMGNWAWTPRDGHLTWSDQIYRIFGLAPREVRPSHDFFLTLVHPDDRPDLEEVAASALRGEFPYSIDHRILLPDGTVRWVHEEALVERGDDGAPERMVGTVQDITERKEAEEQLRRSVEELTRANTELDRFAFVAAHDLQEPLRNIVSYSQRLEREAGDALPPGAKGHLEIVVAAASRMRSLVADLLVYSRTVGRSEPFAVFPLAEAAEAALANLRDSIDQAKAEILVGDLPAVEGDRQQLAMLLQNLIGNAVKYRHAGRPCRVEVGRKVGDGVPAFFVRDNGIGIGPEYREKVFDIFRRLHTAEAYPGTGVGLAICRRIVERHGGTIWVEAEPGKGSTFFFTLRVGEDQPRPE